MAIRRWGWGVVGSLFLFVSPGFSEDGVAVAVSTVPVAAAYIYHGDKFRDPFVPLVGAGGVGYEAPRAPSEPVGPFNPAGAELKGILKTNTGRWAVVRTAEGVTYMVQNGKIYDPKRKAVDGFQGIVKEKTLMIFGPKNQEIELRLKTDADAKKAKP